MDKNLKLVLATLAGVGIVAAVALTTLTGPPAPDDAEAAETPITEMERDRPALDSGPGSTTLETEPGDPARGTDSPSAFVRSDDAGAPPVAVPDLISDAALQALQTDPTIPGTTAWWAENVDFLELEQALAVIVETFGSLEDAYVATADPLIREELIYMLLDPDLEFDDETANNMFHAEHDSELRAMMLEGLDPQGFYDDDGHDYVDLVLLHLLNQPTPTPIGEREWMARMDLARLLDTESAIRWASDAHLAHPDSAQVNFMASTILLEMNAQTTIAPETLVRAADRIRSEIASGTIASYSEADRMRAYNALLWSENTALAREVWQRQIDVETNPNVQRMLQDLLNQTQATAQSEVDP